MLAASISARGQAPACATRGGLSGTSYEYSGSANANASRSWVPSSAHGLPCAARACASRCARVRCGRAAEPYAKSAQPAGSAAT
eukprot:1415949-Prymnesium_polylepis.1